MSSIRPSVPLVSETTRFTPFSTLAKCRRIIGRRTELARREMRLSRRRLRQLSRDLRCLGGHLRSRERAGPSIGVACFYTSRGGRNNRCQAIRKGIEEVERCRGTIRLRSEATVPVGSVIRVSQLWEGERDRGTRSRRQHEGVFPHVDLFNDEGFFRGWCTLV